MKRGDHCSIEATAGPSLTREPIMVEDKKVEKRDENSDVEGHVRSKRVEPGDDTEGHVMPGEYDRDGRGVKSKRPGQG